MDTGLYRLLETQDVNVKTCDDTQMTVVTSFSCCKSFSLYTSFSALHPGEQTTTQIAWPYQLAEHKQGGTKLHRFVHAAHTSVALVKSHTAI